VPLASEALPSVAVTPDGLPSTTRLTVPVKLPPRVTETVAEPEEPACTEAEAGEMARASVPGVGWGSDGPLSPPQPMPRARTSEHASARKRTRDCSMPPLHEGTRPRSRRQ